MTDTRSHFHQDLESLERNILDIAERCINMTTMAVEAVIRPDLELADRVAIEDEGVDQIYIVTHNRWINTMARQGPVGSDLRLMSVLLHLNTTLERTGDQCVNIAEMAMVTKDLPRTDRILEMIREMGDLVTPMLRTAVAAFVRRDVDEARLLPAMDEPIDRLNRNMYRAVVDCGAEPALLEWATRMMMVARALERIGDQAVDIGEQVVFLVTGEFVEFADPGTHDGDRV